MTLKICSVCKGEYDTVSADGTLYYHVCHPSFKNGVNENRIAENKSRYNDMVNAEIKKNPSGDFHVSSKGVRRK